MAEEEGALVVMPVVTNLRVLKPSRKSPRPGDVFVMQLPDSQYLFGWVISTTAKIDEMTNAVMIYIFKTRSGEPVSPSESVFRIDNLLVPPLLTNRLPWSRGYFMTIAARPIAEGEVLERHCFRSPVHRTPKYYDELGSELSKPLGPVGEHVLHSYRTIDDLVSEALGLPLPSDGEGPEPTESRPEEVRIRVLCHDEDGLRRLLRLEDEFFNRGAVWEAGYSKDEEGRIWHIDTRKGLSLKDILRRVREEGLEPRRD